MNYLYMSILLYMRNSNLKSLYKNKNRFSKYV